MNLTFEIRTTPLIDGREKVIRAWFMLDLQWCAVIVYTHKISRQS